jgi:glutathione synthase/RimK-type ligase-like ATP-grasp enzyme
VTNDPAVVMQFRQRHGRVVYKSISSVRSIVKVLEDSDVGRLEAIRWCPVQFQQYIEGLDLRVHVVGDELFATEISSDVPDYRYANRQGGTASLRAVKLPFELAERCLRLSHALGLPFSGIDLKVAGDGTPYCLEVNPSPGFSYFERQTGQPIARAVASYLAGPTRSRATSS